MPRQRKPVGYERWTWAEIHAGRRMSRAEKRWNRIGNNLDWQRRPDGSYQAPPEAAPVLVVILGLMMLLGILAPNGLEHTHGDAGLLALVVFFLLIGAMLLLLVVGQNRPRSGTAAATITVGPAPAPLTPARAPSPPVLRPAAWAVARWFGGVLSGRWIGRLPDWAQPIAWSLLLTCPPIPLAVRWHSGGSPALDSIVAIGLVAWCGAGYGLVRQALAARSERRQEKDAQLASARAHFRSALIAELRLRPLRDFDFESLIARESVPRFEADYVAGVVYRQYSDNVVEDGVITATERRHLDMLASVLGISRERVEVIESAAKCDRFRRALADTLADGVITEDEARSLQELRESLQLSPEDGRIWPDT